MPENNRAIGSEGLEQGGPSLGNDIARKDLSVGNAGDTFTTLVSMAAKSEKDETGDDKNGDEELGEDDILEDDELGDDDEIPEDDELGDVDEDEDDDDEEDKNL